MCLMLSNVVSGWSAESISLVPRVRYRELARIQFQQLEFEGKRHTITYEPPAGWYVSPASSRVLKLYPGAASDAEASIESAEFGATAGFDIDTALFRQVPEKSEAVELVNSEAEPIQICGRATRAVSGVFTFFGRRFRLEALFLELSGVTFTFKFTALEAEFARLNPRFRSSLYTWQAKIVPGDASGTVVFRSRGPTLREASATDAWGSAE
jgi:hypothetical protein